MFASVLVFAVIAFLYASVGFGGGSSYTAILIESGLDWRLVPLISLACNIIVVSGGVYHFARSGSLDRRFALPLVVASVPAAFVGGLLHLDRQNFFWILGLALMVSGLLLILDRQWAGQVKNNTHNEYGISSTTLASLGLILGGLAGVTGIGGGVYLAPVLHIFRLAPAKTVAATCSLFILLNSLAGLAGQATKLDDDALMLFDTKYLLLPLAVLIGGQLGSRFGAKHLPAAPIRRITGVVVLIVAARILWQI